MKKDFQIWHSKKELINNIEKSPFFHEREIWFCYLGANVGFEQDGRGEDFVRPVLVLRKFSSHIFWAVPLTKAKENKKTSKFYYNFSFIEGIKSAAILSQIRLIDAKRIARYIGVITEKEFTELTEKLKALLP